MAYFIDKNYHRAIELRMWDENGYEISERFFDFGPELNKWVYSKVLDLDLQVVDNIPDIRKQALEWEWEKYCKRSVTIKDIW